eukprot:gene22346-biopygen11742
MRGLENFISMYSVEGGRGWELRRVRIPKKGVVPCEGRGAVPDRPPRATDHRRGPVRQVRQTLPPPQMPGWRGGVPGWPGGCQGGRGEQDTGAGVARGVWRGRGAGMSCSPRRGARMAGRDAGMGRATIFPGAMSLPCVCREKRLRTRPARVCYFKCCRVARVQYAFAFVSPRSASDDAGCPPLPRRGLPSAAKARVALHCQGVGCPPLSRQNGHFAWAKQAKWANRAFCSFCFQ